MASSPAPDLSARETSDVRPIVRRTVNNRSLWIFGALATLAALGLFWILESRREARQAGGLLSASSSERSGIIAAPPPLPVDTYDYGNTDDYYAPRPRSPIMTYTPAPVPRPLTPTSPIARSPRTVGPAYYDPNSPDPPYIPSLRPAPVDEPQPVIARPPAAAGNLPNSLAGNRATATRLARPSMTVPQGAIVLAVLETALDSDRPGFVRAIVSRDVRGFDGTRVLIPRGSRLFGEYKSDMSQGQSRAFVLWQRLTRPDGDQIQIDSPAADPLGRSGIKGKVNTHFFERFSGAILQSSLDIGVGIATRSATNGTVVVGLPGSATNISPIPPQSIKPTLKVKPGSSVSVFVARDLDFSTVE